MSSDSEQWPTVTTDFLYMVKLGDYQHVLRPADRPSSVNLQLAQQAVSNIDMARNLMTERSPFLLSEKQQKMDELIIDTEEAINRVIRLLEPARVDKVSEDSFRINPKNAWALRDEPKSAATFGRLQIAHTKLKTVLHDLRNIEATAQLDTCDVRATTTVGQPFSQLDIQSQHPASARDSILSELDPGQLLSWKRTSRNRHRRDPSSDGSFTSGITSDDHDTLDVQSPVSSPGNTSTGPANAPTRNSRDQRRSIGSLLPPDTAQENGSILSPERLAVIHELDGGSTSSSQTRRPHDRSSEEQELGQVITISEMLVAETHKTEEVHSDTTSSHLAESSSTLVSSPDLSPATPALGAKHLASTPQQSPKMKRETFADYRRRNRESRHETENDTSPSFHPSKNALPASSSPPEKSTGTGLNILSAGATDLQSPVISGSPSATQPEERQGITTAANGQAPHAANKKPSQGSEPGAKAGSGSHHKQATRECSPPGTKQIADTDNRPAFASAKPATFPPISVKPPNLRGQLPLPPSQFLPTTLATTPDQILSPSRAQLSPQAQTPSSAHGQPTQSTDVKSQPRAYAPITKGSHEIFLIDPKLTRLPSLLRAGPKGRSIPRPPYPISDHEDELEESQDSDLPRLRQIQSAVERPITAPPVSQPPIRSTHPPFPIALAIDENPHHRSYSDTSVPQINVQRVPTIPRKPLPPRNSMVTPGFGPTAQVAAEHERTASRTTSTPSQQPHDVPNTQQEISGPPSPYEQPNGDTLDLPKHGSQSNHNLSLQEPSLHGSSKRSSVSVEEGSVEQPVSPPPRPKANPLAMHPINISASQTSAYQAQTVAMTNNVPQWKPIPPDYRSPAYQQSRHFIDPGHNTHLGLTQSRPQQSSRFRDDDHIRPSSRAPIRSSTVPVVPIAEHALDPTTNKPRRASEQDQAPLSSSYLDNTRPTHPQQSQPPIAESQDEHAQSRPKVTKVYLKPQQWQQQQQATNDRPQITRTAPPADLDHDAKRLPLPPNISNRGGSLNQNAKKQKSGLRDKELFGRQVWRPPVEKKASPSKSPEIHSSPQTSSPEQQQQQQPTPPQQRTPQLAEPQEHLLAPPTPPTPHQLPTPELANTPLSSKHSPRAYLSPLPENQVQDQIPGHHISSSTSSTTSTRTSTASDSHAPIPTASESGPRAVVKKRSSWLAHQANKLQKDRW